MPKKKTVAPSTLSVQGFFRCLYPVAILLLLCITGATLAEPAREPAISTVRLAAATTQAAEPSPAELPPPTFVDEQQCVGCHMAQVKDWKGSHHQLAMQIANVSSVLGDFNSTTFTGEKDTTQFFRKGDEFWVNALDGDGKAKDFKVAYAFGVAPLQQYLLEAPGGRLQALGVAWDTEKHRWFHIYPGQGVDFKDPLHWSKPGQNANFMCVDCHTTGFKRNFDPVNDSFDSQWNSLGVGCQACHGPASNHLRWTGDSQSPLVSTRTNIGFDINLTQSDSLTQVDTCARCHARRAPLSDDQKPGKPLMDAYLPSTLTNALYELDGKIKDEVFEHGSFLQSKMFAKGVSCSNCHNPHSTQLKVPGNALCLQCHNTVGKTVVASVDGSGLQAKNYDSPEHHHHAMGQAGSQCVDCHMPGKLFMVNDLRHDHSFTLPNPFLASRIGNSDACLGCHADKPADLVLASFKAWYGEPSETQGTAHYAQSLWQARTGQPGAAAGLFSALDDSLVAEIRRATLLAELPNYPSQQAVVEGIQALHDRAPQVREVAVNVVAAQLPPEQRLEVLGPLLRDPILAVRIASAQALLGIQDYGSLKSAFDQAIGEYEQAQLSLQERAEANLNLAMLYQAIGRVDQVEHYLRTAIKRDADFLPAWVTLVQWLDANNRQPEADELLSNKLKQAPQVAMVQFTHGLALVRRGQAEPALQALREANRLEPDNARYAYALSLSLQRKGDLQGARQLLQATLQSHPQNRDVRLALAALLHNANDVTEMNLLIESLKAINPGDPLLR